MKKSAKLIGNLVRIIMISIMSIGLFASPLNTYERKVSALELRTAPTLTSIEPSAGPNDLDISVVIKGADFEESPLVYLGEQLLEDIVWVDGMEIHATVPWGMEAGTYTLTVENPGGETGSLQEVYTVEPSLKTWQAVEINGGSIAEIEIAYNDDGSKTLYAASTEIGLFRSKDLGQSWELIYSGSTNPGLAVDPVDPERIYLFRNTSLSRSDDGGETWTRLELEFPPTTDEKRHCGGEVAYPHPEISGRVFAGSNCGKLTAGLLVSDDYGETWQPSMDGITDPHITSLAYHPIDTDTMAAGTANGNIFISKDGGSTWKYADKPVAFVNLLVFDPHSSYNLWVNDDPSQGDEGDSCVSSGIRYGSSPDYKNWVDVNEPSEGAFCGRAGIHFSAIEDRIYIAKGKGYISEDGGLSWEPFGPDELSTGLTWANEFETLKDEPKSVFMAGNTFGMQCTQNHGDTWVHCNEGLTAFAPDQLASGHQNPEVVFGMSETSPGLFRASEAGMDWEWLFPEKASSVLSIEVDPFIPDRIYLGEIGSIQFSEDGGETLSERIAFPIPEKYSSCTNDIEVIKADPVQEGLLLAGVRYWCDAYLESDGGIYRSTDYGENWEQMIIPEGTKFILDIGFSAKEDGVAFAITHDGQFLKTTDKGLHWQINDIDGDEDIITKYLAVEPVYPYRILTAPDLYVSQDEGASFEALDKGTALSFREIEFTPSDPTILYAATSIGLKRSMDGGGSWAPVQGALENANILSLAAVSMGERIILYLSTSGDSAVSIDDRSLIGVSQTSDVVTPGVYRYTQTFGPQVFFPLITY